MSSALHEWLVIGAWLLYKAAAKSWDISAKVIGLGGAGRDRRDGPR